MINLEQIKKNYTSFDDAKIEHLAKNATDSLEPDVVQILMNEIEKRGLNPDLTKVAEYQRKEITYGDLWEFTAKITGLPCPDCGSRSAPLVGSWVRTVKSFIVFTSYSERAVITCKSCSLKRRADALTTTLALGWWGIPYGIIKTPITVAAHYGDEKKKELSDEIIAAFVLNNIGELRLNFNKEEELVAYIRHHNDSAR